jgi:integrase
VIEIRLRFGKGARARFDVATEARAAALRALAQTLSTGDVDPARAESILRDAAKANNGEFDALRKLVEQIAGGKMKGSSRVQIGTTFRALAEQWVSGELHRKWPDHVKLKRSAELDEGRLDVLYKTIGDVRLDAFTLEDAERAMAALPKSVASSATRRQYAQLISKVLKLAVYPCRLIERSPLPVGFLPTVRNQKVSAYLYPDEDSALLACRKVPLLNRVLYGFLAREGLRLGEALSLRWLDLDLTRGVVTLDENKTDDPRAWALSPGVAAALEAYRPQEAEDNWLVFGGIAENKAAEIFRGNEAAPRRLWRAGDASSFLKRSSLLRGRAS